MIELPESTTLASQLNEKLKGRSITDVFNATHPHKFTFYNGDPLLYRDLLVNKTLKEVLGYGAFVDLILSDEITLSMSDGVNIRYFEGGEEPPKKYQLLLTFDDESYMVCSVTMYGNLFAFKGDWENKYHRKSRESISPLNKNFNETYFNQLFSEVKNTLSVKAFLATEQRIPGLGNGVLQDILYRAGINPKSKLSTLTDKNKKDLFQSVQSTLSSMAKEGGRDTETNIWGKKGGYKTFLSKNTYKAPCPKCRSSIIKEAYLGGSIYYCPVCQPLPHKKRKNI